MRRADTKPADSPLETFFRLAKEGRGLELLRQQMPHGSTLAEAHRLREKILQLDRKPSKLLDDMLGIIR